GSVVGSEYVAGQHPDGYTLLVVSIASAVNPWLYKLSYDPAKSLAPVAMIASAPIVVLANPSLPAKSIKELIALAKAKPGELAYAWGGIGSSVHLGGERFKLEAGADILHVPSRGGTPAMVDVIGGHSQLTFATITTSIGHVHSGKLIALGVGAR